MKNTRISNLKYAAAPLALGLALISTPSFAQTEAPAEEAAEAIVVTGSRIARPDLEVASPVNVVTSEEIDLRQPNSAEDLLRELPSARPSLGPSVNNGSDGSASVNLRGIGDNRTLVILDGRRIVPFGLDGIVDLNVIPTGLVERVDVVTGGASSVYGADAVAGVVNFITKRDFAGFEMSGNYRTSEKGDALQYRGDLLIGANTEDGRGNVVLGLGYGKRNPLLHTERDISKFPISSTNGNFLGSTGAVPAIFQSGLASATNPTGLPTTGVGAVINPATGLFRAATQDDTFNTNIGTYFITPLERINAYASGRFEISDAVEVYATGMFTRNSASIQLAATGTFSNTFFLPLNNPYLPAGAAQQICAASDSNPAVSGVQPYSVAQCNAGIAATGGSTTTGYLEVPIIPSRRLLENGPRGNPVESTMFQIQSGVRGNITESIKFDVSAQYGETNQNQTRINWGSASKVQQALRAFDSNGAAAGGLRCQDTANGCVPLNLFGANGSITPDQLAFIDLDAQIRRLVKQSVVTSSISGDLFGLTSPLSSSAVAFSVGAEYRKLTAQATPDSASQIQGEVLGTGARTPPDFGTYNVKEVFGELIVPLVEDNLIHSATFEGGIRLSDYSTTGRSSTWKAGGTIEPIEGFKVRGMYQVAVRSPNIQELFQSPVQGLSNLTIDPCAGSAPTASSALCSATGAPTGTYGGISQPSSTQINVTTSGNPNLDVEKAKTYTVGAVLTPSFVPRLAITVDYFNIKISDLISAPSQNDILNGCYSATLNPTQTPNGFCQLIKRNPLTGSLNGAGETPGVILGSSNLGRLSTAGIDFGVTYSLPLGTVFSEEGASLRLGLNGTWLDYYRIQATPISINRECTGLYSTSCTNPRPEWKWNARATFKDGPVDVSLLWNHISKVKLEDIRPTGIALATPAPGNTASAYNAILPAFRQVAAYDFFDLALKFNVNENLDMGLLVENLFDKQPPLLGAGVAGTSFNSGNTLPTTYDPIGRAYTLNARLRF